MRFVIFHGSFGHADDNWFPELAEKLIELGQEVIVPQFPVDTWDEVTKAGLTVSPRSQSLSTWLSAFEPVAKTFQKNEKLCFVGHSLGCVFILHLVEKFDLQLDSALFVSPFLEKLGESWQIDLVNATFYKTDFDFEKLKKHIPISYVLYSDNDPYVDQKYSLEFAKKLSSSPIFLRKAGHMNSEVNLNEFPLVFDLCSTRLDLSLYQKYIAHRKNLYDMEYVKTPPEAIIKLAPSEIMDEEVFHFRNLKKEGFCTTLAWLPDWDPENKYFRDGRRAAKRMKNFTRVFLLKEISDLERPVVRKHLQLDLAGGVKVYLCMLSDIKEKVEELDFGIWDNDYVCIIRYDIKGEKMEEIELDSRSKMMQKAQKWKKAILDKATRISHLEEDITRFTTVRGRVS